MVWIKMRLDQRFVIPNDQNYSLNPARHGFFNRVLDQRFAGNGKHLLGKDLCRGEHPGAEARSGNHGLHDFLDDQTWYDHRWQVHRKED